MHTDVKFGYVFTYLVRTRYDTAVRTLSSFQRHEPGSGKLRSHIPYVYRGSKRLLSAFPYLYTSHLLAVEMHEKLQG